jgi:hypothetical protein
MMKRLKVLMVAGVLATVALIGGRPSEASAGGMCDNEEIYTCIVVPIQICYTDPETGRQYCEERDPLIILYSESDDGGGNVWGQP